MENSISYFEDLIKDLQKKYPDFTKEELSEIAVLNLQYIKDKTKDKDIVTIQIPDFAKFYFNVGLGKKQKWKAEHYKKDELFDILLNKFNAVERVQEEKIVKYKAYRRKSCFHFKDVFKKRMFIYYVKKGIKVRSMLELWKKVTEKQNKQ